MHSFPEKIKKTSDFSGDTFSLFHTKMKLRKKAVEEMI